MKLPGQFLGRVLRERKENMTAIDAYEWSILLDDRPAEEIAVLAELYQIEGDWIQAATYWTIAAEKTDDGARKASWRQHGELLRNGGTTPAT